MTDLIDEAIMLLTPPPPPPSPTPLLSQEEYQALRAEVERQNKPGDFERFFTLGLLNDAERLQRALFDKINWIASPRGSRYWGDIYDRLEDLCYD